MVKTAVSCVQSVN